ncbi:unnamed protein product [Ectocarpus sp. CCAP 1310/34]|nr:unnamed protein product [Ectocarpus sp. CCAP 1310/34]
MRRVSKARVVAQLVLATAGALAAQRGYPRDTPPSLRLEIDRELSASANQAEVIQGRQDTDQVRHPMSPSPPYSRLDISGDLSAAFNGKGRQSRERWNTTILSLAVYWATVNIRLNGQRKHSNCYSRFSGPLVSKAHDYSSNERAAHTASGEGLYKATAGIPASFTIQLVEDNLDGSGGSSRPGWEPNSSNRFIYVWISNEDQNDNIPAWHSQKGLRCHLGTPLLRCMTSQILIAEVVGDGNTGTLTATYKSDFPGDYLVYVEEVQPSEQGEGLPIVGSPFSLTIGGDFPTLDVNSLHVCGSQDDRSNDIADTFWRPGTWLSSNVASAAHGVMRNGWVFQPKSCVFDTFSYQDLMLLASLDGEPTWLVVLGGSVQRGVFLTLVDMALAAGQKDEMATSTLGKCWGYADLRVGNLRLTYQDMRLYRFVTMTGKEAAQTESVCDVYWYERNPTMAALEDVSIAFTGGRASRRPPFDGSALSKMDGYQARDSRVSFMSAFPMYQAKFFENEGSKQGTRRYGGNIHYHYISSAASNPEAHNGSIMVHSTMTEMLANVMIGRAVETKAALYAKAAASTDTNRQERADVGKSFQVCSDCPRDLMPFHVKPIPEPICETAESLRGEAEIGEVWNGELCPDWCMKQAPVSQLGTQSGPVDVRECSLKTDQP